MTVFAPFVSANRSAERSCGMQCTVMMSLVAACAAALSRITVCMQQTVSVWRSKLLSPQAQNLSQSQDIPSRYFLFVCNEGQSVTCMLHRMHNELCFVIPESMNTNVTLHRHTAQMHGCLRTAGPSLQLPDVPHNNILKSQAMQCAVNQAPACYYCRSASDLSWLRLPDCIPNQI